MPVSVLYKHPSLNIIIKITDITKKNETLFRYKLCIFSEDLKQEDNCSIIELTSPLSKSDFEYEVYERGQDDVIIKIKNEEIDDVFFKRLRNAIGDFSKKEVADKVIELLEKLKELLEKQVANDVFILSMTEKVKDYGGILDVYFKGINVPKRIEEDDLLDSRGFKKWFIQNFRTRIKITEDEYSSLIQNWFNMAERHYVSEDPLTSFFLENFLSTLNNSYIYNGWTNEAMDRLLNNQGAFTFVVFQGKLWVPAKVMQSLRKAEKTPIKAEKIRSLFKDFLINDNSVKDVFTVTNDKKVSKSVKFWVFDWEKMKIYYPSLSNKELIEASDEQKQEIDIIDNIKNNYKNTIDIPTLLSYIRILWDKVQEENIQIDKNLEDDIRFVIDPANQKDMDNYEWLQEIIEKTLSFLH